MEKAQKLLDDANAAYNKSYAVSTDVHNQKNQRTSDLNAQSTLTRNLESQAERTLKAEVDGSRAVWQNAYKQWMGRRMEAGLAVPPMPVEQNAPPAPPPTPPAAATATTPNGSAATGSAVSGTPLTSAKSPDLAATEEEREAAQRLEDADHADVVEEPRVEQNDDDYVEQDYDEYIARFNPDAYIDYI